jgi:hypothetical protein
MLADLALGHQLSLQLLSALLEMAWKVAGVAVETAVETVAGAGLS